MSRAVNRAVCTALGIDPQNAVAITVRLRIGQDPTVTVVRSLLGAKGLTSLTDKYKLMPADTPEAEPGQLCPRCAALEFNRVSGFGELAP